MITAENGQQYFLNFRNGLLDEFEKFYNMYSGFVYNIALSILNNKYDAEDICHDIFLEIYRNPASFDPAKGSIEAWLAVKTKCRCIDFLRRNKHITKREIIYNDRKVGYNLSVEDNAIRKISFKAVIKALKKIPKNQRQVIFGNYLLGRTHRELACDLKRPLGSVKSSIRYGLKNLQKQLKQTGWFAEEKGDGV